MTLVSAVISWIRHQNHKSRKRQAGLHQTKKLPNSKGNKRAKRQPTEWEKIFVNHASDNVQKNRRSSYNPKAKEANNRNFKIG